MFKPPTRSYSYTGPSIGTVVSAENWSHWPENPMPIHVFSSFSLPKKNTWSSISCFWRSPHIILAYIGCISRRMWHNSHTVDGFVWKHIIYLKNWWLIDFVSLNCQDLRYTSLCLHMNYDILCWIEIPDVQDKPKSIVHWLDMVNHLIFHC